MDSGDRFTHNELEESKKTLEREREKKVKRDQSESERREKQWKIGVLSRQKVANL